MLGPIGHVSQVAITGITILVSYLQVKLQQPIWRLATCRFLLRAPILQMNCCDVRRVQLTCPISLSLLLYCSCFSGLQYTSHFWAGLCNSLVMNCLLGCVPDDPDWRLCLPASRVAYSTKLETQDTPQVSSQFYFDIKMLFSIQGCCLISTEIHIVNTRWSCDCDRLIFIVSISIHVHGKTFFVRQVNGKLCNNLLNPSRPEYDNNHVSEDFSAAFS